MPIFNGSQKGKEVRLQHNDIDMMKCVQTKIYRCSDFEKIITDYWATMLNYRNNK